MIQLRFALLAGLSLVVLAASASATPPTETLTITDVTNYGVDNTDEGFQPGPIAGLPSVHTESLYRFSVPDLAMHHFHVAPVPADPAVYSSGPPADPADNGPGFLGFHEAIPSGLYGDDRSHGLRSGADHRGRDRGKGPGPRRGLALERGSGPRSAESQ